jgi:hypothetical protein
MISLRAQMQVRKFGPKLNVIILVAPVRESLAQALSILMLKIGTDCPLVQSITGQLQVLMLMNEEKVGSLYLLTYFFSRIGHVDRQL